MRAIKKAQGMAGEHLTKPPYGYKVDPNDKKQWIVDEEAVFERVQELRANKRRPTKAERQGLFSGLVFCADCGSKLHFATCKSFDGSQDHYRCANYKSNTGSCTAHFIREENLKAIVRQRIFHVTALFYEDDISGTISHERFLKLSAEYEAEQKELAEKVGGKRYQKVVIVFNFVGELHFPTDPQTERAEQHEQEKTA